MNNQEMNSWWRKIAWLSLIFGIIITATIIIALYLFFRMIGFKWFIGLLVFLIITYFLLTNMDERTIRKRR